MKLSLTWIFDHIACELKDVDIKNLLHRFTTTTAEIEEVTAFSLNFEDYALGTVEACKKDGIHVNVPEWKKTIVLEPRPDCALGASYLVKKNNKKVSWVKLSDIASTKDGLLCALDPQSMSNTWKTLEINDYIITIENTSITHRPDLWSHRGVAREMAALLDIPLIQEEEFLSPLVIKSYEESAKKLDGKEFESAIVNPHLCARLALFSIPSITYQPSQWRMAFRLSRIDARPLDAIVDATNYVMFDFGQPMHAFDARAFTNKRLSARSAKNNESLVLLDGKSITLNEEDCVIANEDEPLSLAGIMGGKKSGIQSSTQSLIIESGSFNPVMIRKSSLRHKLRTESSVRFEKGIDPNQNTIAIMRFVHLLDEIKATYTRGKEVISLGKPVDERIIIVSHECITKKIGIPISAEKIQSILKKIGFGITEKNIAQRKGIHYEITVPTFRLRDSVIPEDIIEEVARFIGYDSLPKNIPLRPNKPVNNNRVYHIRAIKNQLAYGFGMHEVYNYALFDKEFLRVLEYVPEKVLELANPISENWQHLVSSLIPHLLKSISHNSARNESLAFFECGATWHLTDKGPQEKNVIAGVWYHPQSLDFYECKARLTSLFSMLHITPTWNKRESLPFWCHPYQAAELMLNEKKLGYAGMVMPFLLQKITSGVAFAFEFELNELLSIKESFTFTPLPKYQRVTLDISVLAPDYVTVQSLETAIKKSDERIIKTMLLDYYEKPEWGTSRSITLRYSIVDHNKTLTKEDIDRIQQKVLHEVKCLGVMVR